ncbi:MAG: hypothetical protein QOJ65_1447, partial [Fimbriimonadaceae bacterium]|nr:hypothetical protein [Fimbriimonadaceae bacterium]
VKFPGNLKQEDAMISKTLATMLESAPAEADVLSLERKTVSIPTSFYRRMDWPGEPTDEQLRWMPHQILRWIKAEEQIYEFLKEQEDSPFKAWLDDPNAADLVVNRSNEG